MTDPTTEQKRRREFMTKLRQNGWRRLTEFQASAVYIKQGIVIDIDKAERVDGRVRPLWAVHMDADTLPVPF